MDKTITACIDDSEYASAVCDAAAWASRRLTAPMSILHVIDNHACHLYTTDAADEVY